MSREEIEKRAEEFSRQISMLRPGFIWCVCCHRKNCVYNESCIGCGLDFVNKLPKLWLN